MTIETRARSAVRAVGTRRAQPPDFPAFLRHAAAARRRRRGYVASLLIAALLAMYFPLSGLYRNIVGEIAPTEQDKHGLQTPVPTPRVSGAQGLSSGPGPAGRARSRTMTGGTGGNAQGDAEPLAGPSRILFSSSTDAGRSDETIYVMNEDGSGRKALASGGERPDWSPDGKQVAYVNSAANCVQTPNDLCLEIWVMNIDGSQQRRIGPGSNPDWSPDGRRIAFERLLDPDGDDEYERFVFIMNADGSGLRNLWPGRMPDWSPDGQKLAFAGASESDREYGCTQIWIWEVDGPAASGIDRTGCAAWYPDWSPDGKQIVFSSSRGWNTLDIGIYVANADGSDIRRLTPIWEGSEPRSALNPGWSSDGQRIVYMFDIDGSYSPNGAAAIYCREVGPESDGAIEDGYGSGASSFANCRTPGPAPEEIYVMNADGSNPRHVIQGRLPDFSP